MRIYVDLDGVMSDFRGAVEAASGRKIGKRMQPEDWEVIEEIDNFFFNLKPLLAAKHLFNFVKGLGVEVKILTALPKPTKKLKTAHSDKIRWVRVNLCERVPVICVEHRTHKKLYAQSGDILIDDLPENILEWQEVGGVGILHVSAEDTYNQLLRINIERAENSK